MEALFEKSTGGSRGESEAAIVDLFDSPTEEMSRLALREPIGAYYRQIGVTWNGGKSLVPEVT